jgi:hypothetical protein
MLKIYEMAVDATLKLMKPIRSTKDPFVRQLALGCVQMYGRVASS